MFYLVVDEARGEQNVYFLNAVTESDLTALTEENNKTSVSGISASQTCACTDKCKSGKVNAAFTEKLLQRISAYHAESVARAAKDGGTSLSDIIHIRISHEEKFRQHYPELVRFLHMEKEEQRRFMEEHYPQLLDKIRKIRAQDDGSSADSDDGSSPQDKGGK